MNTHTTISTPIGPMRAQADEAGITGLEFVDSPAPAATANGVDNPHLRKLQRELDEYFAGKRKNFTVPLSPPGTEFQKRAWDFLRSIPFGQTRSYGQQAAGLRKARASRACGQANGANRIAIVIPCHRVIAGNGSLGGFTSGLDRKRWLLRHEGVEVGA